MENKENYSPSEKALKKLNLIQKVFEKLAYWNGYDLSRLDEDYETNFDLDFYTIEKELRALNIISQNFKLVGNCLHATNKYAEGGWKFVKEIEDEEELTVWKEVLL